VPGDEASSLADALAFISTRRIVLACDLSVAGFGLNEQSLSVTDI
jgi:hypothetical protein